MEFEYNGVGYEKTVLGLIFPLDRGTNRNFSADEKREMQNHQLRGEYRIYVLTITA